MTKKYILRNASLIRPFGCCAYITVSLHQADSMVWGTFELYAWHTMPGLQTRVAQTFVNIAGS